MPLETGQYRSKARSDFVSGVRSGVNGTPTINGVRHDGAYGYAFLVSGFQMRLTADTKCITDLQESRTGLAIQKTSLD